MKKIPYHRDTLHTDLIAAATAAIDVHGEGGLRLRTIADELSVSPMALYHYFPNKSALLSTLAETFRKELYANASEVMSKESTSRTKLIAYGKAYASFAVAYPHRFSLMFDPRYTRSPEELMSEETNMFGSFSALVTDHFQLTNSAARPHAIFSLWASVHGFAVMASAGPLRALQENPATFSAYLEYHLSNIIR